MRKMINKKYPKGAEWRRWDLHIHSPATCSNSKYNGGDTEAGWKNFYDSLRSLSPRSVIAINDYFFIDGYRKVREEFLNNKLTNIEQVFCSLEFRLDEFSGTESILKEANLHVLFDSELEPDYIERNFINCLGQKYKLDQTVEWAGVLNKENICELGKKLIAKFPGDTRRDFDAGLSNLIFDRTKLIELLKSGFKGRYLIGLGFAEWDQIRHSQNAASKLDLLSEANYLLTKNSNIEKIKYIPQQYFESVCNDENKKGKESSDNENLQFEDELKKVIFSHVSTDDKLRKESLDELILEQTEAVDEKISQLITELHAINVSLVDLESQLYPEYLKSLESKLEGKKKELESHDLNRPEKIKPPSDKKTLDEDKISKEIEPLKTKRQELAILQASKNEEKNILKVKLLSCQRLLQKLKNLRGYLETISVDYAPDLESIGVKFSDVVQYTINSSQIDEILSELQVTLDAINIELRDFDTDGNEDPDSLPNIIKKHDEEIAKLESKLGEPRRKYEEYKKLDAEWLKIRANIHGDATKIDSIKYLENKIDIIKNETPVTVEFKRKERHNKSGKIYDCLIEKVAIYRKTYNAVEDFIAKNPIKKGGKQLSFSAGIKEHGFLHFFFEYINQNVKGSFMGEGYKVFVPLLEEVNLNDKEHVLRYLDKLIYYLENDQRKDTDESDRKRYIQNQIRKAKAEQAVDFYDGLFSLQYFKPTFSLELDGKNISQLSPGEKGALLLIFYLLVDKSEIPLVIDQPEENLDNEFIYQMLVPAINQAKSRRQIIIVTHNPNLAVVCSAEQIIRARIDKKDKNKVSYDCGAIESSVTNQDAIDVLEGTLPAFRNRDSKYEKL